jgi:beta-glucanase (GH16 family)
MFWMTTEDIPPPATTSRLMSPKSDIQAMTTSACSNLQPRETRPRNNLSADFHGHGVFWTPTEIIFEIDGEPVAAVVNNDSVHGPTDIAFSTALLYAAFQPNPKATT